MSNDWMIDVLKDLRGFAACNGLIALAEQIDDAIHVAVTDVHAERLKQTEGAQGAIEARGIYRSHAKRANA
jgi:hypothetical protein